MQGVTIVNERRAKPQYDEVATVESLIKRKAEALVKMKLERKNKKQMLDDSFLNNKTYQEHNKKAIEALALKKKTVAEIAKQKDVAKLKQEVQDISLSIKTEEKLLSDYLLDYTRLVPGATQLELFDGQFAAIIKVAKLSRPKKPKKRRFR